MPRRTADQRHADSAPSDPVSWPPDAVALVDALLAFQHPVRRRLHELLLLDGPAPVGRLAERTGLAPGSVSHHLKPLHRSGFVEPAPELAEDTRQSWWRAARRNLSWNPDDFAPGSTGRQIADLAEQANLAYHESAIRTWMAGRDAFPRAWRDAALATDSVTPATPKQTAELGHRLMAVFEEWQHECRADVEQQPDAERLPVRAITRIFPDELDGAKR